MSLKIIISIIILSMLFVLANSYGGSFTIAPPWQNYAGQKSVYVNSFEDKYIPNFDSIHSFDALHYRLELNFPMLTNYFSGSMTLQFKVVADSIQQISLNMVGLIADSVFFGNAHTSYINNDSLITINLDRFHRATETLSVRIYYHNDFGPDRGYYFYPRNAYTFAEPLDSRWWFPCFDEPWDKATSEIYCTVPDTIKVGSNGHLVSIDSSSIDQILTYHWVNDYPISTYLVNLIMGNYATWTYYYFNGQDSIPIFNMVFHEDSIVAAYDFATVPDMMRIFSDLFHPYPFEKYGQGAVTPAVFGGMEHQTMTTINRAWIDGIRTYDLAMAHELAHQWWGDFVTLSDWRNIWLNEGFASYSSALFNGEFHGQDKFYQNMIDYQAAVFYDDSVLGSYPIYDPTSSNMFGIPVYFKGAWVLHMLRGIIGDSAFFDGLSLYAQRYAYSNASTDDFRTVVEETSGSSLSWFFHEWLMEPRFPEYEYAWSYEPYENNYIIHLEIAQVQASGPIFKMPINIRLMADTAAYDFQVIDSLDFQTFDLRIPRAADSLIFDYGNWLLDIDREVDAIRDHEHQQLPIRAELGLSYPNPFNITTKILFIVHGHSQRINIDIYDILGQHVKSVISGSYQPGRYIVEWDGWNADGRQMSSGVYIIRLRYPNGHQSRKIAFIK